MHFYNLLLWHTTIYYISCTYRTSYVADKTLNYIFSLGIKTCLSLIQKLGTRDKTLKPYIK